MSPSSPRCKSSFIYFCENDSIIPGSIYEQTCINDIYYCTSILCGLTNRELGASMYFSGSSVSLFEHRRCSSKRFQNSQSKQPLASILSSVKDQFSEILVFFPHSCETWEFST